MFKLLSLIVIVFVGINYYTEGEAEKIVKKYSDEYYFKAVKLYTMKTKDITSVQCRDIANMVRKQLVPSNGNNGALFISSVNPDTAKEQSREGNTLTCFADANTLDGQLDVSLSAQISKDEWKYFVQELN